MLVGYPANGATQDDLVEIPPEELRAIQPIGKTPSANRDVVAPLVDGDLAMEQEPSLGDALDDLLDITRDLQQSHWYRQHRDAAVAAALLAWSFDAHWGQHLRDLQGYVHHRLRE